MIGARIRQTIRNHHRSRPFAVAAAMCEKYLRAWHNDSHFEFDSNGERFALSCFADWAGNRPLHVWDVGAHHGEWAEEAHQILPSAHITSFEILPQVARALIDRHQSEAWLTIRNIGLSNQPGTAEITWNLDHDTTNSITPRSASAWFATENLQMVQCPVETIDRLVADGAVPPHFLKIDVEGHDAFVLDGATQLLSGDNAPVMIQFEYGETWIPAGRLLNETFAMLSRVGYACGRLFPRHVDFHDYSYADEHFRMGNIIAVRDPNLKLLLAGA